MSCTARHLLDVAINELGTKESPRGSNNVKYNTHYYGRPVSGKAYPWCCAFVWDVFRMAGASKLFYGGGKTAYCPSLLTYHRRQGEGVAAGDYRPGDVIFFNFSGGTTAAHVGICERWNGKKITTIDGNTGVGNEANGGAVMRRTRDKKYIVGAYRPRYAKEVEDMTVDELRAIIRDEIEDIELERAARPASTWAKMTEAKQLGVSDGTRPQSLATREEVATMIVNAIKR